MPQVAKANEKEARKARVAEVARRAVQSPTAKLTATKAKKGVKAHDDAKLATAKAEEAPSAENVVGGT